MQDFEIDFRHRQGRRVLYNGAKRAGEKYFAVGRRRTLFFTFRIGQRMEVTRTQQLQLSHFLLPLRGPAACVVSPGTTEEAGSQAETTGQQAPTRRPSRDVLELV